jgi:MFS family permease
MAELAVARDDNVTDKAAAKAADRALINAAIIIIVGFFATTLAQPQVLARLPIQNLLKNELHLGRSPNAAFMFLCGLPWYFKPIAGILTDAFPFFGSRRRSYVLISISLGTLAWTALAFTPHVYADLLWVCILINIFMVVASCVLGAYMVEIAQATSGSGRLTALRQLVQQFSTLIRGPLGGILASITFGWTGAACGGVAFLIVPIAYLFMRERKSEVNSQALIANAGKQLTKIIAARTMWAAAGLMALFYVAPGLSTATLYIQQNQLHMNTKATGFVEFLGGLAGITAAVGYGFICRRLRLRTLLTVGLAAASLSALAYLFYSSVLKVQIVEIIYNFGFTLAELALMDLAIRSTPAGSEGLGFSLMMSVRNFALFGTDWLGAAVLDKFHLPFNDLVLINAATTAITVPLVFLLPRTLTAPKDNEPHLAAPAPHDVIQD